MKERLRTLGEKGSVMKTLLMCFATAFLVLCLGLVGCSKDESAERQTGPIEKMTDHAADVAVGKIRTPIDQARSAKDTEEARMRGIDESLKEG